jgi:hypothetical protein
MLSSAKLFGKEIFINENYFSTGHHHNGDMPIESMEDTMVDDRARTLNNSQPF